MPIKVSGPSSISVKINQGVPQVLRGTSTFIGSTNTQNEVDQALALAQYAAATANTANIVWSWTGVPGANNYRLFMGPSANTEVLYYTTVGNTNTITVNTATINLSTNYPSQGNPRDFLNNNYLYGEVSLPSVTASSTAATPDIDYPMNIALPPGYHILAALGTSVTSGWMVTTIAGKY
jgi:hypothetical protein